MLDPSNYTLQVVASKDIKNLEGLIKSENLTKDYAFFPKPVNDSTYYVLVIGEFKTRQEAIDASQQLSKKLRKNKPWPVPLSSILPYLK
jgi:septal ring-binding cell division protein DamX